MNRVKVAAAVLNQTPLDWDGNLANILNAIEQARSADVSILCLPEMCITGYGCEDAFLSADVRDTAVDLLCDIAPQTRGMIVSVGLPVSFRNAIFNTACLMADGKILGFTAKRFLANDGIHYEHRWFKPWPANRQAHIRIADDDYPLGDVHYDCGGLKLGFEICEDAWVASRPGGKLARHGLDLILNPSASHFAFGKAEIRQRFVLEGSRAFCVGYVYANLLGNEAGRAIYDGGALIASGGRLLAAGPRFSFADVHLTTAVIDIDLNRTNQSKTTGFVPSFAADSEACVRSEFRPARVPPTADTLAHADWEQSPHIKEEEFTRAEALALFDYLRKSRSHGFVVSLSGGADSTAVACLVSLMVKLARADLGAARFAEKLAHIPGLSHEPTVDDTVRQLLTTAYQPTENSSPTTRNAAQAIAQAVHATHYEFDVGSLVQSYVGMVSSAIGRPITWQDDDLALQNIQARVRAPGVWMLANLNQALLLSTSNRSEAAVGYATMDGDTCGGVSPIAGIDKAFIRHWLRWLETHGPDGFPPIPELAVVNVLEPTAELRPPSAVQTDEADLMPYDLLDAIERAVIRDKKGPSEVLAIMSVTYPAYTQDQLIEWIKRFFRLWSRNQWKRERYAPSFHLDDENLDPKTWCRFPILSGGFEKELRELAASTGKDP